jgi:hypothetical protein
LLVTHLQQQTVSVQLLVTHLQQQTVSVQLLVTHLQQQTVLYNIVSVGVVFQEIGFRQRYYSRKRLRNKNLEGLEGEKRPRKERKKEK